MPFAFVFHLHVAHFARGPAFVQVFAALVLVTSEMQPGFLASAMLLSVPWPALAQSGEFNGSSGFRHPREKATDYKTHILKDRFLHL